MVSRTQVSPETFWIASTPHSPNSRLPIVVYRGALQDTSPNNIIATIEPNGWFHGGQWKAYNVAHFHSACHECYGVIKGSSTYMLGKSPADPDVDGDGNPLGRELRVRAGDVFVLPVRSEA